MRDAHQSLLATRVRTRDLLAVAGHVSRMTPQLLSLEAWGGATYDVALRFLAEDPWERLAQLREAVPNICLQMLLRGRNTVGYTPYPTEVTDAFVAEAAETGIDIFRIFDALNDVEQMRAAIDAVRSTATGGRRGRDLLHRRPLLPWRDALHPRLLPRAWPSGSSMPARTCWRSRTWRGCCEHLLRARSSPPCASASTCPVHLHTHDTPGGQLATLLAAIDAGVDAVDAASAALSGTTSQPALSALVAGTDQTDRATGLDLAAVCDLEPYWEATRRLYAPFESGLPAPTGRVYTHEIPGGQLSNLRQQAIALGLGEKFEQIEDMYAAANRILGNIVKVTPSSKVVGDLALHLVAVGADPAVFADDPGAFDVPDSVIGFLSGELGDPPGGWPEPFRTKALAGRTVRPPLTELSRRRHRRPGEGPAAHPQPAAVPRPDQGLRRLPRALQRPRRCCRPAHFLYGLEFDDEHDVYLTEGVRLILGVESISKPDERGFRTVMCTINGQLRPVSVRDRSVSSDAPAQERADLNQPGQVGAPVRRRRDAGRQGRRRGRGRRRRRHHRGDEDGGVDHHPDRRGRRAGHARRTSLRRRRGSRS